MAFIGVDLHSGLLNLIRGRDFKWTFDNLDPVTKQPTDFAAGDLFFELDTGGQQNALQEVTIDQASGGTYTLSLGSHATAAIAYDEITVSPEDATPDIQSALEVLPNIGAGNVEVHPAQLFPVWEIDLTLNAGHNEIQQIKFTGNPTGGSFKLSYGLFYTPVLAFGAPAATIKTALEALTGVGTGNTNVTLLTGGGYQVEFVGTLAMTDVKQILGYPIGIDTVAPYFFSLSGGVFPSIQTSTVVKGTAQFTDSMVNLLNTAVNNFFNSFDSLLGVDVEYKVIDNLNTVLTATSLVPFTESTLLTFSVDVTDTLIESFLNSVSTLVGLFATIHVDFYWKRVYQVEFVGDLATSPQSALVPNISSLTGLNSSQNIAVDVLQPGKERFTLWHFNVSGSTASIKVESDACDVILNRTNWQLVFLPSGEPAGGDPIALGRVRTRGDDR